MLHLRSVGWSSTQSKPAFIANLAIVFCLCLRIKLFPRMWWLLCECDGFELAHEAPCSSASRLFELPFLGVPFGTLSPPSRDVNSSRKDDNEYFDIFSTLSGSVTGIVGNFTAKSLLMKVQVPGGPGTRPLILIKK